MKLCKEGNDFAAGKTSCDCCIRKPYLLTSRKLQFGCKKCSPVDAKLGKAKKMIGGMWETMEEVKRKDAEREKRKEKKKESVDHGQGDGSNGEEEKEIASQGQDEENCQYEKSQEIREMGKLSDQENQEQLV
ncbi:hypothetical protein ACHAPT_002032 [Fusarium lateritium]